MRKGDWDRLKVLTASAGVVPVFWLGVGFAPAARAEPEPAGSRDVPTLVLRLGADGSVQEARATGVAARVVVERLHDMLGLEVVVAPQLAGRRVDFRLRNRPLDDLLRELAPAVYVDWRYVADDPPRRLAIHLLGDSEPPAPRRVSSGVVLAGNTDPGETAEVVDAAPPPADGPRLEVRLDARRVSVSARQKGLGVILFEVAQAFEVPFEMRAVEAPSVDQIDVVAASPSELTAILGRGAGVDVRTDVKTGEEWPLRFFLSDPSRRDPETLTSRNQAHDR